MERILFVRLVAALAFAGMLFLGITPGTWAACTPDINPMGINLTQVIEPPGGYIAGGLIEITLRITAVCTDVYDEPDTLRIVQGIPPGWAYDSLAKVSEGAMPDQMPEPGQENELAFEWSEPVALPVTMTYFLFVPETERSVRQLDAQAMYSLGEDGYASDVVIVDAGPAKENALLCCGGGDIGGRGPGDWVAVLGGAGLFLLACRKRLGGLQTTA